MLAEQELCDGDHPEMLGASEWISTGLRVEETKYGMHLEELITGLTAAADFPSRTQPGGSRKHRVAKLGSH